MSGTIDKVKHALHLDKDKSTSHTTTGNATHSGTAEGVHGPHGSRVANAADPRIDSDLDGSRNGGAHSSAYGSTGVGNHTTGTHTTTGHQNGGIAAKLNPADHSTGIGARDGTQVGNSTGNHHTGTTGGISRSTNAGPHDSNVANKLDPRVDSDLDSTGNRHGAQTGGVFGTSGSQATPGSGTAQNTAGPHNSDTLIN